MATAKKSARRTPAGYGHRRQGRKSLLLVVLLCVVVAGWFWREPLFGMSRAGAAFGAHTACSCRFVGGRELGDCRKDFEPGMQMVFLTEDEDERTVTARVPLLARETARHVPGRGCVLDPWKD